ncbi:CPBP family intramembrane metalloprotease [Brevibacillus antibioticus]|uniref:CPBP family intramembrane metalloprotease n=1 Tax=Brevibacillus antibioticus TaxID=2570228 RepID=A0A4U2YAH1_9BACL|nr:CPBP family intramembrane glutamic endopeptidase [Brevibacillus antibioticus]TKI56351.1 CPBP family intramembrane metalloprotease [Brevibacillus antibioticus]
MKHFISEFFKRLGLFVISFFVLGWLLQNLAENGFSICIIFASLITYFYFDRKKWSIGLKLNGLFCDLIKGLYGGCISLLAIFTIAYLFEGHKITEFAFDWTVFVTWTVFCIIAVLGEEILIRGYIYGILKYKFGALASSLISSGLFAAFHFTRLGIDFLSITTLFLAGVWYAQLREKSGAIWVSCGFHFAWNYTSGLLGIWRDKTILLTTELSQQTLINGGEYGIEGSVFSVMTFLSFVVFTYVKSYRTNELRIQMKR